MLDPHTCWYVVRFLRIYIYIYIYMIDSYTHTHTHTHIYIYIYISECPSYINIHAYTHRQTHTRRHAHMYMRVSRTVTTHRNITGILQAHMYTYEYVATHTHTHTHTHIYIYIYTYTTEIFQQVAIKKIVLSALLLLPTMYMRETERMWDGLSDRRL